MTYDFLIIGGGIVGLSAGYHILQEFPRAKVVLLEKESAVALHQSGRNSGVIHSGIYYPPGSLKAKLCTTARQRLIKFCDAHSIPYEMCGKVIVATSQKELSALDVLLERGQRNGVACRKISVSELSEIEPHVKGKGALHVEDAGIIDYRKVCYALKEEILSAGGEVISDASIQSVRRGSNFLTAITPCTEYTTAHIINCAGLHADRMAQICGVTPRVHIVPFRGEYFTLSETARDLCRNLIYPVPDPRFPFLGVHLTRTIEGDVHCGPNAVLAFAREGYRWRDVSPRDLWDTLTYSGFLRLSMKYCVAGAQEMYRSISQNAFTRALQNLVPDLRAADLERAPAGVRAQAVEPSGILADDFIIQSASHSTHVLNAPSPAATSSLEIGKYIAHKLHELA